MRYLGDINTRARGLRTRLLQPRDLERLARTRSLFVLQRELGALGVIVAEGPATPEALEAGIRRRAGELMAILGRWCTGGRQAILAVLLEDEDRRSIQRILRGAEQGAGSDTRMSGLVPTSDLSERALQVLASQPTMADVVRMLVLWRHPLGLALVETMSGTRPSLFEAEVQLQRAFAARALSRASEGGADLVDYVRQVIDLMNAWSLLLHFPERDEAIAGLIFVEGGRWIDRSTFDDVLAQSTAEDARARLVDALRSSPLARPFGDDSQDLAALETIVLRAQIGQQSQSARLHPDGAAPVIRFALELRAEVLNLRRIVWGVALQAPSAMVETNMVVP
jgi:vacuolar-type H+-ATPase subunit C/Vma6